MNLLPGLNWFRSVTTRRDAATHSTPDPGDMGTAFGLEVSLNQPEQVPVLAAPAPSRAPGWVRRHVLRNRASP